MKCCLLQGRPLEHSSLLCSHVPVFCASRENWNDAPLCDNTYCQVLYMFPHLSSAARFDHLEKGPILFWYLICDPHSLMIE